MSLIPGHVLTAFGTYTDERDDVDVPVERPAGPEWDNGIIVGDVVYAPATDYAHWSAKVRDKLAVHGMRVSRPLSSTDGRFIVGGWKVNTYLAGTIQARVDESVAAALRLEEALEKVRQPNAPVPSIYTQAQQQAWSWCREHDVEVDSPRQVGHADLFYTMVYDGEEAPGLTDVVPFATAVPRGTTAALAAIDALIAGAQNGVDSGVLDRFAHVPNFGELIIWAIRYRMAVNDLHPNTSDLGFSNTQAVWDILLSRSSATI